jgi:hypothetical protein
MTRTRTQTARAERLGYRNSDVSGTFVAVTVETLTIAQANALRLEGYYTADADLEALAVETLNWIRAGRPAIDCRRFSAQKLCQTFLKKIV